MYSFVLRQCWEDSWDNAKLQKKRLSQLVFSITILIQAGIKRLLKTQIQVRVDSNYFGRNCKLLQS